MLPNRPRWLSEIYAPRYLGSDYSRGITRSVVIVYRFFERHHSRPLADANQRIRHGQITDFSQLWGWCEYPLGSNTTERRRFMDHMSAGARTPDEAHTEFEESVKRWLVQQSRAPPRRQRDSDNVETDSINVIADRLARESEPTEQLQRPVDLSTPAANATLEEQEDPNWRVCFQCLTRTARYLLPFIRIIFQCGSLTGSEQVPFLPLVDQ